MSTSVQEQICKVFNYIRSENNGFSREDVINYIDNTKDFFWTNYISIDEMLENNLVIGRLSEDKGRYTMTEKGEKYLTSLLCVK